MYLLKLWLDVILLFYVYKHCTCPCTDFELWPPQHKIFGRPKLLEWGHISSLTNWYWKWVRLFQLYPLTKSWITTIIKKNREEMYRKMPIREKYQWFLQLIRWSHSHFEMSKFLISMDKHMFWRDSTNKGKKVLSWTIKIFLIFKKLLQDLH